MYRLNILSTFERNKSQIITAVLLLLTFYLFWNTGIHGDDYTEIRAGKNRNLSDFLSLNPEKNPGYAIAGLPSFYLFWWIYQFISEELFWIYDVVKWLTHLLSIWLIYQFATDYLPRDRAFLATILFIFNPVHDSTEYWYMTVPYILTPSLIMYAHCLIRHNRYKGGLAWGILGSFMNYSSPPYALGLSIIFFMEKAYKKAVIFLIPAILYIIFYFSLANLYPSVERRIDHSLTFITLVKNYVLQIFSFLDSAMGPSFLLKVWWALNSISWFSLLLALAVISFILLYFRSKQGRISIAMLSGLIAVLLLSFGMFSLTGLYNQIAFNLGNRVTVYGSLLIAFLIASLPLSKKLLVLLAFIFVIPIFGLSDYWKSWNVHQQSVIQAIEKNSDLRYLTKDDILLVSGNIYSKLGPFSHIEFFAMPWAVQAIFKEAVRSDKVMALAPYVYFDGKYLVDPKFGERIRITESLYYYNSDKDQLIKVSPRELPDILSKRLPEIRHWTQLIKTGWIHSIILELNPRLGYLFK